MPQGKLRQEREKYAKRIAKQMVKDCQTTKDFCPCLKKKIAELDERGEEAWLGGFLAAPFSFLERGVNLPKSELKKIYSQKCNPQSLENRIKRLEEQIRKCKKKS